MNAELEFANAVLRGAMAAQMVQARTMRDDDAIRQARSAAYRTAPYWPFGHRTAQQELIQHPAKHVRSPIRRAYR